MDRLALIGAIVTDREVDRGLGGLPIEPPESTETRRASRCWRVFRPRRQASAGTVAAVPAGQPVAVDLSM
jgi:hypothetical protein